MKILLIDDSRFVTGILQKQLAVLLPGCETDVAADGQAGYERYCAYQPDVIFTDLLMPILTGQELIRRIRETDTKTRIIVISADVQRATRDEVEALGISGFISKPVTPEKVAELAKLVLGGVPC